MSVAFAPFQQLRGFHVIGNDRFQASCPTSQHAHGDRSRGLHGRIAGNKVLINCAAGCPAEDVLTTMGLTWSALFLDSPSPRGQQDSDSERRRRAMEGLRAWRETETLLVAEELRTRDQLARATNDAFNAGSMSEDEAFGYLEHAYRNYSELEYRFEILRTGTDADAEELWRQSRGVLNAA